MARSILASTSCVLAFCGSRSSLLWQLSRCWRVGALAIIKQPENSLRGGHPADYPRHGVGLGGIAAASTAFLIHRDRRARADEEQETGSFLDEDEESLGLLEPASAPSAHPPGEVATAPGASAAVDADGAEPRRPSRGLPADGDDPQPPTAGRRGI